MGGRAPSSPAPSSLAWRSKSRSSFWPRRCAERRPGCTGLQDSEDHRFGPRDSREPWPLGESASRRRPLRGDGRRPGRRTGHRRRRLEHSHRRSRRSHPARGAASPGSDPEGMRAIDRGADTCQTTRSCAKSERSAKPMPHGSASTSKLSPRTPCSVKARAGIRWSGSNLGV